MLVRVPVIGTIGRAVRLNPDATVGGQIGVNIKLPDGKIPSFEELAIALNAQLPPAPAAAAAPTGTIFETDIIDGTILARVAAAEQITGIYNFVNGITSLSYDGILAANLVDKTAAETISGAWEFTSGSPLVVTSANPRLIFDDTNAAAEQGVFIVSGDGEQFSIGLMNDARSGSTSSIVITRTGLTTDQITFTATTIRTGAKVIFDGKLFITESATADASDVARGQFWVRDDVPNTPMFTGDTGISQELNNTGNLNADDAETITAAWDFVAITATSYDGVLAANLLDKSAAETISQSWVWDSSANTITFTGGGPMGVQFRSVNSTTAQQIDLLFRTGPDTLAFERTSDAAIIIGLNAATLAVDIPGALTAQSYDGILAANLLDKSAAEIITGEWNIPSAIKNKTASYTLVIGDAGQTIRFTGTTASKVLTIPANASVAFTDGTLIAVHNDGTVAMTLVITTDTLTWAKDNTTGTRTLAPGATLVIQKVASTNWKIAGSDLVT